MLPGPEEVAARWRTPPAQVAAPDGAPRQEYARTPAAARIAQLATDAGLFHFHFERRAHLPLPEAWIGPGAAGLADPPQWSDGVLPEAKYQSFRHDLAIASYHPHHRAKWAVHELCHGLVGFAWRRDATPFFHATAGRLAELLPVALWYFFDEAFLRRCPDHQGAGSLFRTLCPRCEAVASPLPDDPHGVGFLRDGLTFVDRELTAIARSRRLGRPIPHLWATIDLCSDGVAYARAHGARLASDDMAAWADRLLVAGGGWSPDLDQLEARVVDVLAALLGEGPAPALAPTPAHARWRWILADVGFRLATVRADTDGEALDALDAALDVLAAGVQLTTRSDLSPDEVARRCGEATVEARVRYDQLAEEWEMPDGRDVFALGYAAPGADPGGALLADGVRSVMPLTTTLLDAHLDDVCDAFARADGLSREPVAARFARFLADAAPAVADLAAWEALTAHLPTPSDRLSGPAADDRLRLADGFVAATFAADVLSLAERVDAGAVDLVWVDGHAALHAHDGEPPAQEPFGLVVGRDDDGEIVLVELDADAACALRDHPDDPSPHLDPDERAALAEVGVLVPVAWAERA